MRCIDVTGKRFGKLIVLGKSLNKTSHGNLQWICKCDCGGFKDVYGSALRNGYVKSCGCENGRFKNGVSRNKIHGFSKDKIFLRWLLIMERCYNTKATSYKNYGGRGIIVCDEWKNDFTLFRDWALKNGWKSTLTIERKNSNGNYEPSNCEWIPKCDQWMTKRNTLKITIDGKDVPLKLHYLHGNYPVSYKCVAHRISRYKWTVERALNTPTMNSGNRKKKQWK